MEPGTSQRMDANMATTAADILSTEAAPANDAAATQAAAALNPSDAGMHLVMFWLLLVMAGLVFAPCIIVPVWMETQNLMRAEDDAARTVAQLDAYIAEQNRLIEALTSDPLVNERIARRDLRFRRPGEEIVPSARELAAASSSVSDITLPEEYPKPPPAQAPALVKAVSRWLPNLPWVDLFGKPPNRTIFLFMSGGLLVAAFVLFGHHEPVVQGRPPAPRTPARPG